MGVLSFLEKEGAEVGAAIKAEAAALAAPAVEGASDDTGPVQDALDTVVDVWITSYTRRPVIHAGLVALRGLVDMTAPLVRAALLSKGLKIVRVDK